MTVGTALRQHVEHNLSLVRDHVSGTLSDLDMRVIEAVPPGGNWRDLPADFPSRRIEQIRASAARGEGSRSTYYGRLRWDAPSYTISTYFTRPGNGCFIHPSAPRLLTVREAARLQTFPDAWIFTGTMRQRAMQIGNAVPPLLAMQVASVFTRGAAVDLFAGAGGLSLGMKLAGHEVLASVDFDSASVKTHDINFGGGAIQADLDSEDQRRETWGEIRRRIGGDGLELLAGGPPCQGFSTAGKSLKEDPRNRLVWSYVEGVEKLRPRSFIMENVVALAQSRGRAYLDAVRTALENLGYSTQFAILHAEAYGVPQRRRRVILAGTLGRTAPTWPVPWREMQRPFYRREQPLTPPDVPAFTVRDAIGNLPQTESRNLDDLAELLPAQTLLQSWLQGDRMPLEEEMSRS